MSHKRKGMSAVSDEWARHLRPDGRREFWSKHRQAEKLVVETGDDAITPMPSPAKKQRKRKAKRLFAIEHRYLVPRGEEGLWVWSLQWRVVGRYETAAQRDESLIAMTKRRNHGFSGASWPKEELRVVDLKA